MSLGILSDEIPLLTSELGNEKEKSFDFQKYGVSSKGWKETYKSFFFEFSVAFFCFPL
jgi:hypothetical protein